MIEQVIIRLLSDQELKRIKYFIVTTEGYYYGHILGYEEGVLELEVETIKGREKVYIVVTRIVAIELAQRVKEIGHSDMTAFLERSYQVLGACRQHSVCCDTQSEEVKHLFRMIKCTTSPEHVMAIKLENNNELVIQIKYLAMALRDITIFYQKGLEEDNHYEILVVLNNAYVDSVSVLESETKQVPHHQSVEGKLIKGYK